MTKKLSSQELSDFCRQFAIILHSGIPAVEGLRLLGEEERSPETRALLEKLLQNMEETGSLSETLSESGLFPETMISYLKNGEETGCLDEVMDSLARYYEQDVEIRDQIKTAVSYPLLMLGMMAAVIVILLVKVLPVFQQVFRQMGLEMQGVSGGLLAAGQTISRYSTVFFVILAVLLGCILFFALVPKGRAIMKKLAARLPYIREIPISMDYSRLTQSIAMGLRTGYGAEISMELAEKMVSHPDVKARLHKTGELMEGGLPFEEALKESGLFSGMDARLISIGFKAGSGEEVMERLSERYQENSVALISQAVSVVEPTIVIILSVLVGLVLLSVMMPLLGILSEMIV